MANAQIIAYIKSQLAAGVVEPEIQKALVTSGWSIADVSAAFVEAKAPTPAPVSAPAQVPASKPAASIQPLAAQPMTQTTMQMNVQGTPGRRWGIPVTIVVIILLLVGGAAAAYKFVPAVQEVVGFYLGTEAPIEEVATTTPPNIQTDLANGYSVTLPAGMALAPISIYEETLMQGEIATSSLPEGSMEAAGLFVVSKIPQSDIARGEEVYDYAGCCTGARYWFDASSTAFKAESIVFADNKTSYKALPLATTTPVGTACTIARTIGTHTYYRIASGDEAVPTTYFYFLPVSDGTMLRFMSRSDLDTGGGDIAAALGSLTLSSGSERTVQCQ